MFLTNKELALTSEEKGKKRKRYKQKSINPPN